MQLVVWMKDCMASLGIHEHRQERLRCTDPSDTAHGTNDKFIRQMEWQIT